MALKSMIFRSLLCRNKSVNLASVAVQVHKYEGYRHRYEQRWSCRKTLGAVLFGAVLVGSSNTPDKFDKPINVSLITKTNANDKEKDVPFEAGQKRPDLPTFKAEEVSKHDNKESFWVTYKSGVYDVTKFLISHPGGEQIMNAAGLSIEPFWNVYGMHKTEEVYRLLESFRIGNLHEDDIVDHTDDELWVKEPVRSKQLIVKTAKPFNAEIPPKSQIEHFDTPNELFYVRQHMPVPELEAKSHRLRVIIKPGKGVSPTVREFSLEELGQFQKVRVRAALMCAGNRRSEMNKVKPVKGINWAGGAISNAVWGGVLLRDVLLHCGLDPYDVVGKHVIFQGSDIDATGVNFSTSIPLHMALDPNTKVLLATEMNDQQLPLDHGYPLRGLVPGAPAVRSVKWLETIIISEDESPSHWHQKDYRAFNPSKTWDTANFETAPPVYSLPVTSAICEPLDGDTVEVVDGHVEVKGYAYSGGGAKVLRVDVTSSAGATWLEAEALAVDEAPPNQHFSWMLWRAQVPVTNGQTEMELWVKATDSNFNTQPAKFDDIWNIRGILSNAYHRININLKH